MSANTFVALLGIAFAAMAVMQRGNDFRIFNFSAGPGPMPTDVLKAVRTNFLDHEGTGMNIMEMSHRDPGGPVQNMIAENERMVRELLDVPDDYHVLYMAAGAHLQFAAVAMNLLQRPGSDNTADYVITGYWSDRAMNEAAKQGTMRAVQGASEDGSTMLPVSEWDLNPKAAYVHICASETIDGLEFLEDIEIPNGVPLVGDFTSTLLSRKVDISKYGVIYASGGKNLGPSGFALVIVRKDLVSESSAMEYTPAVMSWHLHSLRKPIPSIYHTPPTFNLYVHHEVLKSMIASGGMGPMGERSARRANAVYAVVDESNGFYNTKVSDKRVRSRMNVAMTVAVGGERRRDLEELFVAESKAAGMLQLFGHPVRGGLRVTLYNGVPDAAVDAVVKFMRDFQAKHQ